MITLLVGGHGSGKSKLAARLGLDDAVDVQAVTQKPLTQMLTSLRDVDSHVVPLIGAIYLLGRFRLDTCDALWKTFGERTGFANFDLLRRAYIQASEARKPLHLAIQ